MTYPISDNYMTFNEKENRYVLTEQDIISNLGIDVNERLKNPDAVSSLLNQISIQVYRFIHQFNVDNAFQDYVIAHTEMGRKIIKSAMEEQFIYVMVNGDLSRSTDEKKRALWFDDNAKEILMQTIPEIRTHILYSGRFPRYRG